MRNYIKLLRSKFKKYEIDDQKDTRSPGWLRYQKRIK